MRPGIPVGPQGFGGTRLLKGRCPSFHSLSGFSVPGTLVPNVLLIRSCYRHQSPAWIGVVALGPVLAPVAGLHALYLFHGLSAVAAVHPGFPGRPGVVPGAASCSPSFPWQAPAPHSEERKPARPSAAG